MNDRKGAFGLTGYIALLLSVFMLIAIGMFYVSYSKARDTNEDLQEELRDRNAVYAALENTDLTVEYVEHMYHSATDAGREVADLVNASWDVYWHRPAGMSDDDMFDQSRAYLRKVSGYFPSAYDNGSDWYAHRDKSTDDSSVWEFMTTYSFSGHKIDCVWICYRQSDRQILAYVTSVFDAETGTFTSPSHHTTVYGSEWGSNAVS